MVTFCWEGESFDHSCCTLMRYSHWPINGDTGMMVTENDESGNMHNDMHRWEQNTGARSHFFCVFYLMKCTLAKYSTNCSLKKQVYRTYSKFVKWISSVVISVFWTQIKVSRNTTRCQYCTVASIASHNCDGILLLYLHWAKVKL